MHAPANRHEWQGTLRTLWTGMLGQEHGRACAAARVDLVGHPARDGAKGARIARGVPAAKSGVDGLRLRGYVRGGVAVHAQHAVAHTAHHQDAGHALAGQRSYFGYEGRDGLLVTRDQGCMRSAERKPVSCELQGVVRALRQ